jgi:transcriptional regulator with XRE-family HTH domain
MQLIDAAKTHTGSDAETARRLGVTFQEVSNWRHGRRTCPPDMKARLAQIAGLDPTNALIEAVMEGLSEPRKTGLQDALKRAGAAMAKF